MNSDKIHIESLPLSIRALNCCSSAGIKTLQDLVKYYSENRSFNHLQNCGKKTNKELVDICHKYEPKLEKTAKSEFESFLENLSVRAFNCVIQNFSSKEELFTHYYTFKNFLNLKSSGKKTSEELKSFCLEQSSKIEGIYQPKEDFENIYSTLNDSQLQTLNTFFKLNQFISSPRVQKLLEELIDEKFSLLELRSRFHRIDLNKIYNIGKKTFKDVRKIISSCEKFVEGLNDPNSTFETIISTFLEDRSLPPQEVDKYRNQFFNSEFQLFSFLDQIIKKGGIFNEKESLIFLHRFKYFANETTLSLEDIAANVNLTRERIRQLQQSVDKKLIKSLSFLLFFKQHINYPLNLEKALIIIKNGTVENINRTENVNFTNRFYTKIFHLFLFSTHQILNDRKDINSNSYLIRNNLYQYFDFECFFEEMSNRFSTNIKESYSIDFDGFLLKYWRSNLSHLEIFSTIKSITEDILYESFDTIINLEGNIEFRKNAPLTLHEIIPQILEKAQKPLSIHEIKQIVEREHLFKINKIDQLRSAILKNSKLISISRTSTYGLAEWHHSIKGGTIKDIVYEFLDAASVPKSMYEITKYVNKFRDTNSSNILGNLKADPNKRFLFFHSNMVGLIHKEYPESYHNFKKLNPTIYKKIRELFKTNNGKYSKQTAISIVSSKFPSIQKLQIEVIIQNYLNKGILKVENGKIVYDIAKQN